MQVADRTHGWDMLKVATGITLRVVGVDKSCGVEGLMHITNIVDDQADGHRFLIVLIRELISNF